MFDQDKNKVTIGRPQRLESVPDYGVANNLEEVLIKYKCPL